MTSLDLGLFADEGRRHTNSPRTRVSLASIGVEGGRAHVAWESDVLPYRLSG
jgi:hypothetical protein